MGHDLLSVQETPRTGRTESRLAAARGWGRRQWHGVAELAQESHLGEDRRWCTTLSMLDCIL